MLDFLSIAPLCIVMLPVVILTDGEVKIVALAIQLGLLLLQITCSILRWVGNRIN